MKDYTRLESKIILLAVVIIFSVLTGYLFGSQFATTRIERLQSDLNQGGVGNRESYCNLERERQ